MLSEKRIDCWYSNFCKKSDGNPCSKSEHCPKYLEMEYLMENSGLPKAKQKSIELQLYDDCDEKAYERLADIKSNIVDFVESGKNLIIAGENTGNGKTMWSIKLLHKYFDQICIGNGFTVRGVFVHVPTLLLNIKNFDDPLDKKFKKRILDSDLVVWDDIGGIDMTSFDYDNLLLFLEARTFAERSNIFTTNITTEEQFLKNCGQRLTSRIWLNSEIITFKGEDKRGRV